MSKRLGIIGAIVLAAIVYITYQPGYRMGLYLDDYYNIERAGRIESNDAFRQIFDPRVQTLWYRPLQGLQFYIEYYAFGGNGNAYHFVNITYHAINTLLLYLIAWRISKKWRIGLVSALLFTTTPVYAAGVNWSAIVDPLMAIFYLLSVWFWWRYLEDAKPIYYALALVAFLLSLMGKQMAVTIPIVLFLADWLLMGKPLAWTAIVRRYALFGVVGAVFMIVQALTPSTHTFAGTFGWQFGTMMIFIFVQYLTQFFFPYGEYPPLDLQLVEVGDIRTYTWTVIAIVLIAFVVMRWRSKALLFLSAFAVLTILPVLPFPFIEHRYLYVPIMAGAVMLALLFDRAQSRLGNRTGFMLVASAGCALIAFGNGFWVQDAALGAAEWARQLRVPYRDIERQNPTFPKDTLLYFVDPITPTEGGLSGMFFLRYGKDVVVKNWTQAADLRAHNTASVYYFGDDRSPQKIEFEKNAATQVTPSLPIDLGSLFRLEGYEIARTTIKRGAPIAVIAYWRSLTQPDHNYTMFFHLVDRKGKVVAQYDNPPRKGQLQTSQLDSNRWFADTVLIQTDSGMPLGDDYQLEFGWYDTTTLERLIIVNAQGQSQGDRVTIQPFKVIE